MSKNIVAGTNNIQIMASESNPQVILVKAIDALSASTVDLCKHNSDYLVYEDDIQKWVKQYITSYTSGSFIIPGLLEGQSIDNITSLSEIITIDDKQPILLDAEILITLKVAAKAQMPTPSGPQPDPMSQYKAKVKFVGATSIIDIL